MSEEQLSALLIKLKEDSSLRGKFQAAEDLDTAVELAKKAGFDVSKADLIRYQASQALELGDDELEGVAGGEDLPRTMIRITGFICMCAY